MVSTPSFGPAQHGVAYAIAVQPDGKIVVTGVADGGDDDYGVARLNLDGTLDQSFGGDGTVIVGQDSTNEQAYGVAIHASGRILISGASGEYLTSDFALAVLRNDGSVDTSFQESGWLMTDFHSSRDYAQDVIITGDTTLLAGSAINEGTDFALARYTLGIVRLSGPTRLGR